MKISPMDKFSYLHQIDLALIEELYEKFKQDPESVEEGWRKFLEGFEFSQQNYPKTQHGSLNFSNEFKVLNLITAYRQRGHYFTKTNPVRTRRKYTPTLDIENFGLTPNDLSSRFQAGKEIGLENPTLQEIITHLNRTYCHSIGVEYFYIRRPEIVEWFIRKMEPEKNTPVFSHEEKVRILKELSEAVLFEQYLHKKFPGNKRFSLEGAESLIPAMHAMINKGAETGVKEFVIGMAHRGRLNVLANILHKPMAELFSEFEGKEYKDDDILGDVKYHLGYASYHMDNDDHKIHVILCPNPSHLEAVDPVVEGIARERIDHHYFGSKRLIPVLIHGDASVAGLGIVYETLQMSELSGYATGGTIHIVINNQIGFTTNFPDARSSIYCTDVAKTVQAPIFHVNGDDVEAMVYTLRLAVEFRQTFHKDVFIDLLCYRKYGHNESDEPRFTQPVLYKLIEKHPDPKTIYLDKLVEEQSITREQYKAIERHTLQNLDEAFEKSGKIDKSHIKPFLEKEWQGIEKAAESSFFEKEMTAVDQEVLVRIGQQLVSIPSAVKLFNKTERLLNQRREMIEKTGMLDWAMAEWLAYGTLLKEGVSVRVSGEDVERGTFSHRHAVLVIEDSTDKYTPLQHLSETQADFRIYNSLLSEFGVLGFEYGYALASPQNLVIWEAQFGDFINGAQVIVDEFIASAEEKWNIMNGLVLFLPHGYEGQGPDHSSARMERFLSMCANLNMQIVNCTTPANLFHVLRRQVKWNIRKPMIIFTPKSLLRHPQCMSPLEEFSEGHFREVIDDPEADPAEITRLLFCNGKLYYDLAARKLKDGVRHTAVIRLEQIYPLPVEALKAIRKKYHLAQRFEWIQEEPENMGAWKFINQNLKMFPWTYTARPPSGSPATGSTKLHAIQQRLLVEKGLGMCTCEEANLVCKLQCAEKEV